jgi:hypothetical protein
MTEAEALQAMNALVESGKAPPFMLLEYTADGVNLRLDVTLEEYMAIGRVPDCDCQLIRCVCTDARKHVVGCIYRLALTCAIPIPCESHGEDVCPVCDLCTCLLVANGIKLSDLKR